MTVLSPRAGPLCPPLSLQPLSCLLHRIFSASHEAQQCQAPTQGFCLSWSLRQQRSCLNPLGSRLQCRPIRGGSSPYKFRPYCSLSRQTVGCLQTTLHNGLCAYLSSLRILSSPMPSQTSGGIGLTSYALKCHCISTNAVLVLLNPAGASSSRVP